MKLLEPFKLKHITLKNRMIMAGMDTNFGDEEGNLPDKLIDYYEQRAKGGIGMIIVEGAYFDKVGAGTATMLSIDSNKRIRKFKELVKTIKKNGAHALIQIYHAGAQASSFMIGLQAVAPSAIPFEMSGETPIPLTKKQISKIVKGYGEACLRAKKADFDGVEIHAGHGYLLNQFFSLRTNKREDEYGGQTFENRTRAAVEVIREVRKRCGEDFIIGFRLNGSDYIPEGLQVEDVVEIVKILDKEGVDLFNITGGVFDSPGFPVVPYMNYPRGCFVDNAAKIREVVDNAKVSVVGRLNTPESAEKVLEENKTDLVTIGRALIADPDFPKKIKEEEYDSIRVCIGCNTCLNQIMTEQPVACAINTDLIRNERDIETTDNPQKVLIIGAGPAGLEAARIMDRRGHEVVLIEKQSKIGGSINYGKVSPMKKEVQNLINYYNFSLNGSNINLKLGTPFSLELLDEIQPDIVVLATGIRPTIPDIKGIKEVEHFTFADIFEGKMPEGENIVVLGGDMIGIEVSEYLASKNKKVTIVSNKKRLATDVYSLVAREILPFIENNENINISLNTEVEEIKSNIIVAQQEQNQIKIGFDCLITTSVDTKSEIEEAIKEKIDAVLKIGDCKEIQPRKILNAISEGYELGCVIETKDAEMLYGEVEIDESNLKGLIRSKLIRGSFTNEDIPLYLELLVTVCNENEKLQKKNRKSNLAFQISIGEEKNYFIKIQNGNFSAGEQTLEKPDVTIKMDPAIAAGVFTGTVNAATAYMNNELIFEGSMMLGLKFRTITDVVKKELEED